MAACIAPSLVQEFSSSINSRDCPWIPELDHLHQDTCPLHTTSTTSAAPHELAPAGSSAAGGGAEGSRTQQRTRPTSSCTSATDRGALLQQSLLSGAIGSRAAVIRLRSKYASPACLEWLLLIGQCGHKELHERTGVREFMCRVSVARSQSSTESTASSEEGRTLTTLPLAGTAVQDRACSSLC
jgi:hypothetical protein